MWIYTEQLLSFWDILKQVVSFHLITQGFVNLYLAHVSCYTETIEVNRKTEQP